MPIDSIIVEATKYRIRISINYFNMILRKIMLLVIRYSIQSDSAYGTQVGTGGQRVSKFPTCILKKYPRPHSYTSLSGIFVILYETMHR